MEYSVYILFSKKLNRYYIGSPSKFEVEKHIKNMKSKKYIENLKKYPQKVAKMKVKYSDC